MVDKLHKNFGSKLRKLRKNKNLTQEELAFHAGMDSSYLGFVERGQQSPTLKKIGALADALKIDISELFFFDDPKTDKKQLENLSNQIMTMIKSKDEKLSCLLQDIFSGIQKHYL